MKSKKTQYMSIMAMFLAIQIILVVTPLGYLPIGPISATTMHIPVIIAGIALGKKAGAQLGFVFGLTSVLNATFRPTLTSFCFSPFVTIGGIGGNWMSLLIALTGAITNTVLVLGGIYLFFGSAYADAIKVAYDTLIAVLLGVVATNGIAEAILGAVATLLVCKAIRPITRKFN